MKSEARVEQPNALRAIDFTHARTWTGFVCVTFAINAYARRIVGWKVSASAVKMATLRWLDWYNNHSLFGPIGYIPPAGVEAKYYAAKETSIWSHISIVMVSGKAGAVQIGGINRPSYVVAPSLVEWWGIATRRIPTSANLNEESDVLHA